MTRPLFDAAALASVLDRAGSGTMLPQSAYVDDEVLGWERAAFFDGGWVCVGRADGLSEPGARRAVEIGGEGVLLVRGDDGVLRGFANSCRHRAHELLPCGSAGEGKLIRCPYHAWVYRLDGTLRGVPPGHRDDVPDPAAISLASIPVAEWAGFVVVNASGDAPPWETYARGLDELVSAWSVDRLVVAASHDYDIDANWKLLVENYHECFHCSSIHPELCRVSSPNSGSDLVGDGLWLGGTMWLQDGAETMSLDGRSDGVVIPGLPEERRRDVAYLQVFPNLLLSLHPDYVMTHRLEPVSPGVTHVDCQWLFPPEALARKGFDPGYAVDFWDITNRQDWSACESVQRGVASRGYRPGPLSSYHEAVVREFLVLVAQGYAEGGLPTAQGYADVRHGAPTHAGTKDAQRAAYARTGVSAGEADRNG